MCRMIIQKSNINQIYSKSVDDLNNSQSLSDKINQQYGHVTLETLDLDDLSKFEFEQIEEPKIEEKTQKIFDKTPKKNDVTGSNLKERVSPKIPPTDYKFINFLISIFQGIFSKIFKDKVKEENASTPSILKRSDKEISIKKEALRKLIKIP